MQLVLLIVLAVLWPTELLTGLQLLVAPFTGDWNEAGTAFAVVRFLLVAGALVAAHRAYRRRFGPLIRSTRRDAARQARRIRVSRTMQCAPDEPTGPGEAATHAVPEQVRRVATRHRIPRTDPRGYYGYRTRNLDDSGAPDPLERMSEAIAERYARTHGGRDIVDDARAAGRLFGVPGVGLESSEFPVAQIAAGERGEIALARLLVTASLPAVTFWSIHGVGGHGEPLDADIDCIVLGVDADGRPHYWFVDAKNYRGGSDATLVNVADDAYATVLRHAFLARDAAHAAHRMSRNMELQAAAWPRVLVRDATPHWRVTFVPHGAHGAPRADELRWPGGIPCVTVGELIADIRATCVPGTLPPEWTAPVLGRLKHPEP